MKRPTKRFTGKATERRPDPEAPTTWAALLEEAVERPGVIAEAFTRFHSYSFGNALLIAWQCRDRDLPLGPVASYNRWRALGRQVSKGQSALLICMPRPFSVKEKDAETGEEVKRQMLRFVYRRAVFVYAQTEAVDGAEDRTAELDGFPPDWSVERAMRAVGVTFAEYDKLDGNCQGYFRPQDRTIALMPLAEHPERTLLHELAHAVLHPSGYDDEPYSTGEVEAEAVAMLLSHALGFDGADESRGYVQHWLRQAGGKLTDRMAQRIFSAAQKILKAGREDAADGDEQAEQDAA